VHRTGQHTRNILFSIKCYVIQFLQFVSEVPVVAIRGFNYTVLFVASGTRSCINCESEIGGTMNLHRRIS
jgi:hypothetical protein